MVRLSVPSYRSVEDDHGRPYTVFIIEVHHNGRLHRIEKRYRSFHTLHKLLKKEVSTPEFPPKRVRNWNSRILEHRRQGLEHYLQAILLSRPIPNSLVAFLDIYGLLHDTSASAVQSVNGIGNGGSMAVTHQPIVTFVSELFCTPKRHGGLQDMVVEGVLVGLYGSDATSMKSPGFG